jgi:DNA primase
MGDGEPKYLNSPETPLFHKGANLYCLDRARVASTKDQPVIVAEGYMDVIALHGAGFTGAVAPLGTALTEGQLGELWKLADEPLLCFDGDNAGRRAAQRAAGRALPLLHPGKSLRFVGLPAGEDPDSLIRSRGPEAIRRLLELARPLSDVVWELETEGKPADTPERRASIRRAVGLRVREIADPVVREYYKRDMGERLGKAHGAPPQAWRPDTRRPFRRGGLQDPAPFAAGAAARRTSVDLDSSRQERALLGALIERPALLHILAEELARLPIANKELERLRSGLLDALSLVPSGIEPAAEEALADGPPLESQIIAEHLQRNGLGRLAEASRAKAREVFRDDPKDADGWVGQWRRAAHHLTHLTAGPEELRQAEQALAEDMNEENLQRLQAILDRMRRETIESGTG